MEKEQDIIEIVLLGTFLMLTVSITVIYFVTLHRKKYLIQQNKLQQLEHEKQQELLKAVIRAQESERNRLATSIHDSIGAELSMLQLNLSKYAFYLKETTFESGPLWIDINNLDDTIENLRAICRDLYPITLRNYGFVATFRELIFRFGESGKIRCNYKVNVKEEDVFNDLESKLNLLRIVQEILNNLIKHSSCTYLDIGIIKSKQKLDFIFSHDGVKFTNEDAENIIKESKGLGLISINNRVRLMFGTINYQRIKNNSEIIIQLPLKDERKN